MTSCNQLKQDFLEISQFLVAIGDEKRQAIIIRLLAEYKGPGLQVTDLIEEIGLSRPAISHHLKILREANVIDYRREGTKNYYFLIQETSQLEKLKMLLNEITQKLSV